MPKLSITMAEHERAMQEQAHAYEIKLDALRLDLSHLRAAAPAVEKQETHPAPAGSQSRKIK